MFVLIVGKQANLTHLGKEMKIDNHPHKCKSCKFEKDFLTEVVPRDAGFFDELKIINKSQPCPECGGNMFREKIKPPGAMFIGSGWADK
jgi:predicted nucleic acid-binding Zn ribbon protein